jgi:TetR/AcrR family transcriptional repressor of nem operon
LEVFWNFYSVIPNRNVGITVISFKTVVSMARTKNFNTDEALDKAIDLFRKHGYQATTPAQLVSHMGISRSSLYDTYGDKRSLYLKAIRRYADRIQEQSNAIIANATNGRQAIGDYMRMSLDGCYGKDMPAGCLLVNSVSELPADESELMRIIADSLEKNKKNVLKMLEMMQADGSLPDDADLSGLADYLMNAVSGLTISAKSGVSKEVGEQIVNTTLTVLG